jgi:16S rRNA (cytidine1402-2'-O)-methyltransferase
MSARLIVVSTPIGNLSDLSSRALQALSEAPLIACEDTRRTGRLLAGQGIKTRLVSLHEHNERKRVPELLARLEEGKEVVLVSDAGTPLLSDPGFVLVRSVIEHGITVEHIPGPSAVLSALVVSGLPPYPFTFAGFAPPRATKRKKFYSQLGALGHTVVVFESPHRILRSLEDFVETLGDRPMAVARELTKMHEEVLRGTASEVLSRLRRRPSIKGEFTIVFAKPA